MRYFNMHINVPIYVDDESKECEECVKLNSRYIKGQSERKCAAYYSFFYSHEDANKILQRRMAA